MQLCQVSFKSKGLLHRQITGHFLTLNLTKGEKTMTPEAEKFNGWMAMIGIVAALGAYSITGQIIPGVF